MTENRSSGSGRHFHWNSPRVYVVWEDYIWFIWSFDLPGPSYMIASTLVGRAEAPGHYFVSCKGIAGELQIQRNSMDVWVTCVFWDNPCLWSVLGLKDPETAGTVGSACILKEILGLSSGSQCIDFPTPDAIVSQRSCCGCLC